MTRTTGKTELPFAKEKTGREMVGGGEKKSVIYFKPVKFEMLFNIEEEISRRQLYL